MNGRHQSRNRNNLILGLLEAYGSDLAPLDPTRLTDRDVEALYTLGLYFLVLDGIKNGRVTVSDDMLGLLDSADLTARVVHGQLCTVLEEVLVSAEEQSIPVVLLKGIANATDLYVRPHHRTMGDVDVLVAPEHAEPLYHQLLNQGYQPMYPDRGMIWADEYHHLHPLKHPRSGVPIELHTAMFSRVGPELRKFFAPENVWKSTQTNHFLGRPCLKLTNEFDFVYTIAHWANDLARTTNAIGICDIARMLEVRTTDLDWSQIRQWVRESPLLGDYVTVVLDFLNGAGIAGTPAALRDDVAESKIRIGRVNLRTLHFVLSAYSLTGRQQVAGLLSREHADIIWNTILEPGNRTRRLSAAVSRILNLRRQPGESLLLSLLRRARNSRRSD